MIFFGTLALKHRARTMRFVPQKVVKMLFLLLLTVPAVILASVDLLVLGDWGGMPVHPYTMPGNFISPVNC